MNTKRVVVLGATGFAGRNTVDLLRESGHEVHALSRSFGCDLLDLPGALRAIAPLRPDVLVNCAAHVGSVNYVSDFAADVLDDNLRMQLNLYRIAKELRGTVLVNPVANCAFPGHLEEYTEADLWNGPPHPSVLSYGGARRTLDVLARCYSAQFGVRSYNLYVPNMYGPYDSINPNKTHALNALVIKFVRAKKIGAKEVEVWGTGRPIREWLFVKDFAAVVRRVVEAPAWDPVPVSIAQNHGLSVDELVAIICQALGWNGRIVKNTNYPDGAPKKVMNDKLFRQRFPDFRFTDFATGLAETVQYYEKVIA